MSSRTTVVIGLLLLTNAAWAVQNDPCSAVSSSRDIRFALALKGGRTVFQEGEIIPLVLSFTSSTKNRYWADDRNYDRSGRLAFEYYCVEPEVPDPLESYFRVGVILGGGLGGMRKLGATPFTATAELNEWRRLGSGHYRVWAISYRVWRPPDAHEQTPYGRISEVVRSNAVELDVKPADHGWQSDQLRSTTKTLAGPSSSEDARSAARRLRFLNTKDSTRQLAKLFWGLNQQQPTGWDLMFGLYGSPYRQVAIDWMHAELTVPDHAITNEFLGALVNLQVSADPSWDPPSTDPAHAEEARAFWDRRQAHTRELMKAEVQTVVAAVSRKTGRARALTLNGLLTASEGEQTILEKVRPALIAAWADLPPETQRELIQYRWPLIASPEMLPILRGIVAEPPPPARTNLAMTRDAALKHIYEFDAAAGREAILRDLQNISAQPSLEVIKLLPREDLTVAIRPAVERIRHHEARELDYELVDRYADTSALGAVQAAFEEHLGKWACAPQSAMLRYFLRVDPAYGAREVAASLRTRKDTGCYRFLEELGAELPKAQESAIAALDDLDSDVVQDALLALGRWGSSEAEGVLWTRLERFHREWAGREDQLRSTPDYQSAGSRGAALEQGLAFAIAKGTNWISPPTKLARLIELLWTPGNRLQIESWIEQWKQGAALVNPTWFPEENPTFSVLQYERLTEDELRTKLAQFPRGMQLRWQFWQPGQISPPVSMAKQEASYERMRTVAEEHGVVLGKANQP